jgi:hypothetical protein
MLVVLRVAPGALLVFPLALGLATSLRLGADEISFGPAMLFGALIAVVLSPAYLLLAVGLGIAGLRFHRGLKTSQSVLVAMFVSSAVVVGASVWVLTGIASSPSSTAVLGFLAVPLLTLVAGALAFGLTWVLLFLVRSVSRPVP